MYVCVCVGLFFDAYVMRNDLRVDWAMQGLWLNPGYSKRQGSETLKVAQDKSGQCKSHSHDFLTLQCPIWRILFLKIFLDENFRLTN